MSGLVGQTVGNYRIEALLGTGGMGQVFRGVHVHLGRAAAIKVMHPHLTDDPGFQARFLQEARSAAALTHANVVQTWDFGTANGQPYLVMELVESTLRVLLEGQKRDSPLPMRQAIELLRQAAEGLGYAHSLGMVHRDIKPENLLLQAPIAGGGDPTIKVADFGLARLADSEGLTLSGVLVGTPVYMSPEQCQGEPVDARGDVYALGVVLYEAATGVRPFEVKTPTEAIYKHVFVQPPPPSSVRANLPPGLEPVILRCLAKPASERYPTATELARDLQALLDGSGVSLPVTAPLTLATEVSQQRAVEMRIADEQDEVTIGPGQGAEAIVTVLNTGDRDDSYRLSARGVPEDWIELSAHAIPIPAGGEARITLRLGLPPGQRIDVAAERLVTLTARSTEARSVTATAILRCLVLAGPRGVVELTPSSAAGSRGATYQATIRNRGGQPGHFSIQGRSESAGLRFNSVPPEVSIAAGQAANVALSVTSAPRWVGRPRTHTFQVEAGSGGTPASGTFVQQPVLPAWAGALVAVIAVAAVVGIVAFLPGGDGGGAADGPAIASLVLDPPDPAPGEPVTVRWDVSGAERVDLQPLAEGLNPDTGSYTAEAGIADGTTLTLVAHDGDESVEQSVVVELLADGAAPGAGAVVWETDLSAWTPFTSDYGGGGFAEDAYRLRVTSRMPDGQPGALQVLTDEGGYDDFSVSVDMRVVESAGRSLGCLMARTDPADGATGYNLCLSAPLGETIVWYSRVDGGVPATEELLGYAAREGTRPTGEWNTLQIIARGNRLWFLINGALLGSAVHEGIDSGAVGIKALSYDDTPVEIGFTNMVYHELGGP